MSHASGKFGRYSDFDKRKKRQHVTDLPARLKQVQKRFLDGYTTDDGVLRELNAVSTALADGNYQEKLRDAIRWYEIYASPRQSDKFPDGRDGVRASFLQELGSAIDVAAGRFKAPE
jgi:hypothetical protein